MPVLFLGLGSGVGCFRDELPDVQTEDPIYDSEQLRQQRSRLPDAAENCYDDIVGIWVGQILLRTSWHHFTLDIDRVSPRSDQIDGVILTEVWTGTEADVSPSECIEEEQIHYTLEQPAIGSYRNGVLTVAGQSVENKVRICGERFNYFADTFTGAVSVGMNEFYVINDDGWNPTSELLFRRIECDEKPVLFRTWPLSWILD